MTERGFVASGGLPPAEIGALAHGAEELGYSSFWMTVSGDGHSPLQLLEAAAAAAGQIRLGLGLVPLDAHPGDRLGAELSASAPAAERLVCGLGVGRRRQGAARFWRQGATAFREAAPQIPIAVGSYGPLVLRAGGELADAVLLNWMTPSRARWAGARVAEGAAAAARPCPRPLYLFVNTALEEAEVPAVMDRYPTALATYGDAERRGRHLSWQGACEPVAAAVQRPGEADEQLAAWRGAVPLINPIGALSAADRRRLQALCAPRA
jgi:hypothetical protein